MLNANLVPAIGTINPQTVSAETLSLNETEANWLRRFSSEAEISEAAQARIARPSAKKARAVGQLNAVLLGARDLLLEYSGGKPLFSAHVAGEVLVQAGLYKRPERMNSIGDHLGNGPHGHCCPMVQIAGTRYYYVPAIGKSAVEKVALQKELDGLAKDVLRRGIAILRPLEPDSLGINPLPSVTPVGTDENGAPAIEGTASSTATNVTE